MATAESMTIMARAPVSQYAAFAIRSRPSKHGISVKRINGVYAAHVALPFIDPMALPAIF